MTIWDHLLALVAIVVSPLYTAFTYPRDQRAVRERGETARVALYREEALWQLGWVVAVAALWVLDGRDGRELGFAWPASGPTSVAVIVVAAAALAFLGYQHRVVASGRADLASARDSLEGLDPLLPGSRRETAWFTIVALGAGIAEELVWRGLLIWYFTPWVGSWGAAALSIVLFTAGHGYQGGRQLPGIAVAATVLTVLRMVTGTVWIPMLIHGAADLVQGLTARELRRQLTADRRDAAGA